MKRRPDRSAVESMVSTLSSRTVSLRVYLSLSVIGLFAGLAISTPMASAQTYTGNQGFDAKHRSTDLLSPVNPIAAPSREYVGVPIAGWLVNASVLTGVAWDSNVFQASLNEVDDWAARLRPQLEMVRNNGIHSTTIYGYADARFYNEEDDADRVEGGAGVRHIWEVQRDLIVKGIVGYARQVDVNNAGTVITANGLQPIASPIESNGYTANVAVEKHAGPLFFGVAGDASYTDYLDIEDSLGRVTSQDARDATYYAFTGRAGVWVSPVFYSFVQASQGWQEYRDGRLDASAQRVVAGVGSDRISLFKGEIYAGYQRRDYQASGIATSEGSVFGGQLFWYPTRDLTFGLNVDRALGESTLRTAGNPSGSPIETTSADFTLDYLLADIWTLSARAGYSFTDYKIGTREDEQWSGGILVSYFVWRNLAATFEWDHVTVDSNISTNSYDRDVFTVGSTYKY